MLKHTHFILLTILLTASFSSSSLAEEDASMHEVYLAAQAGKFDEAQAMMDKVLKDHPNSAKAHFVEAELLSKQDKLSAAQTELDTAEKLQPGLAFVKPETLQNLKSRLTNTTYTSTQRNTGQNLPSALKDSLPLILIFLGLGLIILVITFFTRKNTTPYPQMNKYTGNTPNPNNQGFGNNGGMTVGQPNNSGIGSGLMGNLATGAALGAGVVAGEALMHHFIDGNNEHTAQASSLNDNTRVDYNDNNSNNFSNNNDLGGQDFGIADNSSWDDDSFSDDSNDDWS